MDADVIAQLRRTAFAAVTFLAILFGWVALIPTSDDGSAYVWPFILMNYLMVAIAFGLLRLTKVASLYSLKIALRGVIVVGALVTLILVFGWIDGTMKLGCWRATILHGCSEASAAGASRLANKAVTSL